MGPLHYKFFFWYGVAVVVFGIATSPILRVTTIWGGFTLSEEFILLGATFAALSRGLSYRYNRKLLALLPSQIKAEEQV